MRPCTLLEEHIYDTSFCEPTYTLDVLDHKVPEPALTLERRRRTSRSLSKRQTPSSPDFGVDGGNNALALGTGTTMTRERLTGHVEYSPAGSHLVNTS
eukprot:1563321-Amphidinium_carterae.1